MDENVVDVSSVGIRSIVVVSDGDVMISVVTTSNVVDDVESVKGSSVDDGLYSVPNDVVPNFYVKSYFMLIFWVVSIRSNTLDI